MKDFIDSFRNTLDERLGNPFTGSFILAWCAWNYKLILVLFSASKAQVKLSIVSGVLYPSYWHVGVFWLLAPTVTALLYVFAYPHPSRFMANYALKQKKLQNESRQKIYDETPLTIEESREIRRGVREGSKALEDEVLRQEKLIKELRDSEARLSRDVTQQTVDVARLEREKESAESEVDQKKTMIADLQAEVAKLAKLEADAGLQLKTLTSGKEALADEIARLKDAYRVEYDIRLKMSAELASMEAKNSMLAEESKDLKRRIENAVVSDQRSKLLLERARDGLAKIHNETVLIPESKASVLNLLRILKSAN